MKNFAVLITDSYGGTRLIWYDSRQDMAEEYAHHLHILAKGQGVAKVFAFELCAGETRENWVKSMGG